MRGLIRFFCKIEDLFFYIKFSIYMKIARKKVFINKNDVYKFFKFNKFLNDNPRSNFSLNKRLSKEF